MVPKISLIVAVSENMVMGKDNKLPWHLPADLKRFRSKSTNHIMILGRKTWDSFGNKPLPNRVHIVVTREPDYKAEGAIVVHSLEEAIEKAKELISHPGEATTSLGSRDSIVSLQNDINTDEIFIIGGGQIFSEAMPIADRLYLTLIHASIEGDTYFPDYSMFNKVIHKEDLEENGYKYTFLDLEKT